jgi:segregation and condensation protein A
MNREYQVKLDVFEGPLDLLLYLVNKAEIDITQIQVSEIARQYLEYLDLMRELNIDIASEYLHMAATLIRIKARELLPPDQSEVMPDEEGIYNREQLIQQLLEYKKYKEAASALRTYESEQIGMYGRGAADEPEMGPESNEINLGNISVFDLLTAFKKILERAAQEPPDRVIQTDQVGIDDCIERILTMVTDREEVAFEELFPPLRRRIHLVVTFMAILELVKMQRVYFRQESAFGSIFVRRRLEKDRESRIDEQQEPGDSAAADTLGSPAETLLPDGQDHTPENRI